MYVDVDYAHTDSYDCIDMEVHARKACRHSLIVTPDQQTIFVHRLSTASSKLEAFCQHRRIRELAIFGLGLRDDVAEQRVDVCVKFGPEAHRGLTQSIQMQR